MGIFERLRKRKQRSAAGTESEAFRLPDECSLEAYTEPPSVPAANRTKTGALIASMGATSDQPEADFANLLEALDQQLLRGNPQVLMSHASSMDALFSPATQTTPVQTVLWQLNPHTFALWDCGPSLLLKLMNRWATDLTREIAPVIYIDDCDSPEGRSLIGLLGQLGWETRSPGVDGAVLLEATRPDGWKVASLPGNRFAPTGGRESLLVDQIAQGPRQALPDSGGAGTGPDSELARFVTAELSSIRPEGAVVPEFSWQLLRLITESNDDGEESLNRLLRCLLSREAGLMFEVDEASGSAPMQTWSDTHRGLLVYPDAQTAREFLSVNKDPDSEPTLGVLPSREVLEWMAGEGAGLGIMVPEIDQASHVHFIPFEAIQASLENSPA